MSSLSNMERMKLEKFFEMGGRGSGYVLDFSDRTFRDFILSATGLDIEDNKYINGSNSKAQRLRAFIQKESDIVVGKLFFEMVEYWSTKKSIDDVSIPQKGQSLLKDCQNIANRLLGKEVQVNAEHVATEEEFINREFQSIPLEKLDLDSVITEILNQRLDEIKKCLKSKASLAVIFLCGSTLEGVLLGIASKNRREFNQSNTSPKDKEGKVFQFHEWSLANFIDVAYSLDLLDEDVKKFSHTLRDFRNYIHPYQQSASRFNPNEHTAKICWQVLQAAIFQLSANNLRLEE